MKKILSIVLVLVFCFSLFACTKNETSVPTFDNSKTTQGTTTTNEEDYSTTVEQTSDDTTTTTEQETTVITAEATTTKSATTTTTKPTTTTAKPTTQATTSGMTKQEALKIAQELIQRYSSYERNGSCCEFEDLSTDEYIQIVDCMWDSLTEDQQYVLNYYDTLIRCECCNTYKQASNHAKKYISGSLFKDWAKDYYIEYNGELYTVTGGTGFIGYGDITIKSFDDNRIIAQVTMGEENGLNYPPTVFTMEKIGGTFKVTNVK